MLTTMFQFENPCSMKRSETLSTFSSSTVSSDMLRDDAGRRRSFEVACGGDGEDNAGEEGPRHRRRSMDGEGTYPLPLSEAGALCDEAPARAYSLAELKPSTSREKLKLLMSAPVIDWEKVRRAQEDHYEHQAQRSVSTYGLAARRNRSMYSRTSHMKRSLERLDMALAASSKTKARQQQHQHTAHLSGTSTQRNASWCFSNGVGGGGIDRSHGHLRRTGSSLRPSLALSRRKLTSATGAAPSLSLVRPRKRQQLGSNASFAPECEPGMAPSISLAAKKAAWDMEVKATLDAAKESLLQGDL